MLNLVWEANSWVLDTSSINTEGSHTEGPTVWRLHSRDPYLQYFQTCEWTISHLQSSILVIVSRIICWVSVRLLSQFIWRTIVSNKNFCKFVWMHYFESVVTRRGATAARTSVPHLFVLLGQSNETGIKWKHKGSPMTRSWSFLAKQLQLLTIIAALMLSFQFLGSLLLWLTFGLKAGLKVQKSTAEIV